MIQKQEALKELQQIPGVGRSVANDLWELGFTSVSGLAGQDPELLYILANDFRGQVQDICLLYTFRCAVYYAETTGKKRNPEKLKWWNWMDEVKVSSIDKDSQIRKRLTALMSSEV